MTHPSTSEQITGIIDLLETELRNLGLWERAPPPPQAVSSRAPFCYDTLLFPQWLQWVFIPRTRKVLRGRGALPSASDIHPLAEAYFLETSCDAGRLLALIKRFDDLINADSLRMSREP